MDLSKLKPAKGSTHKKRRLGRGNSSGTGGHSSTRGDKGQKSRSGSNKMPAWFEGGQMPIYRRLPKFGFKSPFRKEYNIVNLSRITRLIDEERIDRSEEITPALLEEAGAIRSAKLVKVLGSGALEQEIHVQAHAFSSSAKKKIEDAGGTATEIE